MIIGAIAVAIPTVPIPNFLHLAGSLTLRHRQNLRLSGSGLRHGDHKSGPTDEGRQAQNEDTHCRTPFILVAMKREARMAVPHDLPHVADYCAETPEGGLDPYSAGSTQSA
jgi:hypothetical protein